ncbi:MAG: hypothetical protein OHK0012_27400 [Synechococcales cyanobacterium]
MGIMGSLLGTHLSPHSAFASSVAPGLQHVLGDPRHFACIHDLAHNHLWLSQPLEQINTPRQPGSLIKLLTAQVALETGVTSPTRQFSCPGWLELPPPLGRFPCWDPRGHGDLTLTQALAHSCNVHFYELGQRLGSRVLEHALHNQQLIAPTEPVEGVTLAPWLATGQDPQLHCTPLALLTWLMRVAQGQGMYGGRHGDLIRTGMVMAVESGTCKGLFHPGGLAAKTGTILSHQRFQGWVGAFWPRAQPRWVMLVFVQDGRAAVLGIPTAQRVVEWVERHPQTDPPR